MGNWQKTTIGKFLFEREGKFKPDDVALSGLSRINKIDFSGKFHILQKPSNTNMILIKQGDLVISGINVAKGAMGIYNGKEDITATIHYSSYTFDTQKINVEYFRRFLKSSEFVRLLQEQVKGGIKTEIKPKHILSLEIDLPDLAEQKRLLAHFKSVETEDAELKAELTHQQALLKKLRQQILQEAIEGKLTADWRAQNPDVEPASEVLNRIQAEKQQLINDKKIKKQKPLPPISEEEKPFELPDGWVWCRIWDIAKQITSGSRGWAQYYANSGAIFVTMGNLSKESYQLRMNKVRYVQPPENSEGARTRLEQGDLLISITGDVGNLGLIPENFGEAYINQHTCMLRYMKECQNNYFLEFMRSPLAKKQYDAPQRGMKNSFRLGDVGEMIMPLPPLQEQKAIIAKVEKLLTLCDQLETQISQNQQHAEGLIQAVLKEAFLQA